MSNPQVLVAGAGPVGQFAALALARRGVSVQIADTGIWPCKHSYALAVHPQALALFDQYGLKDRVLAASHPIHTIGLYDAAGKRAEIRLTNGSGPSSGLAVVRQDFLEEMLEHELRNAGIRILWRHDVAALTPSETHVTAKINRLEQESRGYIVAHTEWVVARSTEVDAGYVIGADGYNSRVRRTLDLPFPEVGPAQYFAVFEFQTTAKLGNEMRIVFSENGAASVLWPQPNGYCRWGFQLPDYHDTDAEAFKDRLLAAGLGYFPTERPKERERLSELGHLPVLDETHLRNFLAERAPWFEGALKGNIGQITWRTIVRFERRLSPSFGKGRLWLAGDAAHLTGPAGIQSMNLGFFEAHHLAAAISSGDPAELDEYNTRFTAIWRQLHNLDAPIQSTASADPWVAAHAAPLVSCIPAHGADLAALAAQLGLAA